MKGGNGLRANEARHKHREGLPWTLAPSATMICAREWYSKATSPPRGSTPTHLRSVVRGGPLASWSLAALSSVDALSTKWRKAFSLAIGVRDVPLFRVVRIVRIFQKTYFLI